MSKLRVIKERVQTVEDALDLRGLGGEEMLKDKYPWTFLAVSGVDQAHLEKTQHLFKIEIKKGKVSDGQHLFVRGPQNHKEKTLTLFTAGLFLLSHTPTAKLLLGLLDSMAERIKAADANAKLFEEASPDYAVWNHDHHGMTVGETSKLFLSHSGIKLHHSLVSSSDVNELLGHATKTHAEKSHTHLKRVA